MKNGRQLTAARALLNWTLDDLAKKSDVARATIARVENNEVSPNSSTLNKIIHAINQAGVKFTENGVETIDYPVFMTSGKTHEEAYLELLKDARKHLNDVNVQNKELLIMYSDDQVSSTPVNNVYREMRQNGIRMRQMIKEGNTYLLGHIDEYRYIPKELFINRVTLIYGNRVANETSDVLHGVIREDSLQAEIQRNNFNILWNFLNKPTESTARERF